MEKLLIEIQKTTYALPCKGAERAIQILTVVQKVSPRWYKDKMGPRLLRMAEFGISIAPNNLNV
jgi:hypothetical protein